MTTCHKCHHVRPLSTGGWCFERDFGLTAETMGMGCYLREGPADPKPVPRLIKDTSGMDPAEFSAWRGTVTTIGSSDAASICFGSAVAWLEERRGLSEYKGDAGLSALGHALEPLILEMVADAFGHDVVTDGKCWGHPTLPSMHTTPDGRVVQTNAGVEVKAPKNLHARTVALDRLEADGWKAAFGDPWVRAKFVQCQHHLAVCTDMPYIWLAVVADDTAQKLLLAGRRDLVDPRALRLFKVERVAEIIGVLESNIPTVHRLMVDPDWWPEPQTAMDFAAWSRRWRIDAGIESEAEGLEALCEERQAAHEAAKVHGDAEALARCAVVRAAGVHAETAESERMERLTQTKIKASASAKIAELMGGAMEASPAGFKIRRTKKGVTVRRVRG